MATCADCGQEYSGFWSFFSKGRTSEEKYIGDIEAQYSQFEEQGLTGRLIGPRYPDRLCTDCLKKRNEATKTTISSALKNFGPIIRGDFIKGFDFEDVGWLKVDRAQSPSEYEAEIKNKAVLLGATAIIKSNWIKKSETVRAGTSKNGNPFYKTLHFFSGEGKAVVTSLATVKGSANKHGESLGGARRQDQQNPINVQKPVRTSLVIVDALNLARAENVVDFKRISALSVFLRARGLKFIFVFDANARYVYENSGGVSNSLLLSNIGLNSEEAIVVPAGTRADEFILQLAARDGSLVVSNDRFLGYESRFPWILEEGRLSKFVVHTNSLIIPSLDVDVVI